MVLAWVEFLVNPGILSNAVYPSTFDDQYLNLVFNIRNHLNTNGTQSAGLK